MTDYATALARVLAARITDARTVTVKATVVAVESEGFVTFTAADGQTRKGVWVGHQPAVGSVITYIDEGRGIPIVLGSSGVSGWTQATLVNSWVNYGLTWDTAAYRKVGDIVYLRGLVKNGSIPGAIFTLPSGYRPPADILFAADMDANKHARIDVYTSGIVHCQGGDGTNVYLTLSGVSFSTT